VQDRSRASFRNKLRPISKNLNLPPRAGGGRSIGPRYQGKTMRIKPFLASTSFNPEVITLMAVAFERTCRSLQVRGHAVVPEAVARKVIELAQSGERDPVRMSEQAVQSLGIKAERPRADFGTDIRINSLHRDA
jgi:hypothetical protein